LSVFPLNALVTKRKKTSRNRLSITPTAESPPITVQFETDEDCKGKTK
jgi:hypothetical protein